MSYVITIQAWKEEKNDSYNVQPSLIGEANYTFKSKEKVEEFLRLTHILQNMVRGEKLEF